MVTEVMKPGHALTRFDLFRDFFPKRFFEGELWAPTVDVYQEGSEIVIKADLPGVRFEDVKLTWMDNVLTIEGERKMEKEVDEEKFYTREAWYGSFLRRISLPVGTMPDAVKARFEDGVLMARIPMPVETMPREIPIKKS